MSLATEKALGFSVGFRFPSRAIVVICAAILLLSATPVPAVAQGQGCDPSWDLRQIVERGVWLGTNKARRSAIIKCYSYGDIYPEKFTAADLVTKERYLYDYANAALAEARLEEKFGSEEDKNHYAQMAKTQGHNYMNWYAGLTAEDKNSLNQGKELHIRTIVSFLGEACRLLGESVGVLQAFEKAASIGPEILDWERVNAWEEALMKYPDGKPNKSDRQLRRLIKGSSEIRQHWESFSNFLEAVKQLRGVDAQYLQNIERKANRIRELLRQE